MIFLLEYQRSKGKLLTFKTFLDSELARAEQARIDLELELNEKGIDHEVVILEAASLTALRRTHRRYFETLDEIARASRRGAN